MKKDRNKRKRKMPGGYLQNHPGRLPPSSCSNRAVVPPLALAVPVQPEAARVDKEPQDELLSPFSLCFPSLSPRFFREMQTLTITASVLVLVAG